MLTIEELEKRIDRDLELMDRLTVERETVRVRLYRYRKAYTALVEAENCMPSALDDSDNND